MIWKCKNKNIQINDDVLIMGIVNVTPDSFSDGGDNYNPQTAINTAIKLVEDGADIIDLGAQSTRPNHIPVSQEEEWERLKPVLEGLKGKLTAPISVDTYYPYVAQRVLEMGVDIINDVSGVISLKMAEIVKNSRCGWIIMHNGEGSVEQVKDFFEKSLNEIEALGIDRNQICLDMGIGFGKTRQQDLELIANVDAYTIKDVPLLLGTSRKRVIGEFSHQEKPKERTFGNIAADTAAILGGVNIVRIHNVKDEKQGIYFANALKKAVRK